MWSFDVAQNLDQNGGLILAYHKDVSTHGGYVAFADGTTELLNEDQFEATHKASATSPTD
jgi:hypothetical protein